MASRTCGFSPWVRKISWGRKWQSTPVFLPGKSHGQRSLVGCSPWGPKRVGQDWAMKHKCRHWRLTYELVIAQCYCVSGSVLITFYLTHVPNHPVETNFSDHSLLFSSHLFFFSSPPPLCPLPRPSSLFGTPFPGNRAWRLTEVKWLGQGHQAKTWFWKGLNWNPRCLILRPVLSEYMALLPLTSPDGVRAPDLSRAAGSPGNIMSP